MAMVKKSVLIEHSSQQMFDLVDRVEDYPQFLPWCSLTRCIFRDDTRTIATLHINYRSVKSHFTTENNKESPFSMNITLVDGPFRRLDGVWHFKPLAAHACKIEFQLSYEFSSKMFEKVIGPVFSQIANTFVDAFVKRAYDVHGVPNA
ncbi:type II toxin-antitoxin system RatA family toxin [Candidatus Accumulibacter vicinus]|uniref:Toxin RatA n=1 Tax=Candidatus Accumulibacter vicinus TaxID=2954382 RepID=A0A084XY69_9PROT|nr:type II toxin-antitoxin system RatA family toxin [Candidatus Accumulibacter vicinus]KFB67413.1 MAG: Toxin RatA [Candidatus Accumulibacter vicinus]